MRFQESEGLALFASERGGRRKVQPGDVIIIMAYGSLPIDEARDFKPNVIFPDTATNRLV